MNTERSVDLLLAGPRGRDLCLAACGINVFSVMAADHREHHPELFEGASGIVWVDSTLTDHSAATVARAIAEQSPTFPAEDAGAALELLADTVADAMYWQPPDEEEIVGGDPTVIGALRPAAEVIASAPATSEWGRALIPDDQHYVSWLLEPDAIRGTPPPLVGVADRLTAWRTRAGRPNTIWWSTPDRSDVVLTTPSFGDLPATQLALIEDTLGITRARVARLGPDPEVRVFEVAEPGDWTRLVADHPLDVTASRAQNWADATGRRSRWFLPDWTSVAVEYDAVHLTVWGYLSTAGRALPVPGGHTLLGGWEPEVTVWLTDVLNQVEEPTTWIRTGDESCLDWHRL